MWNFLCRSKNVLNNLKGFLTKINHYEIFINYSCFILDYKKKLFVRDQIIFSPRLFNHLKTFEKTSKSIKSI